MNVSWIVLQNREKFKKQKDLLMHAHILPVYTYLKQKSECHFNCSTISKKTNVKIHSY